MTRGYFVIKTKLEGYGKEIIEAFLNNNEKRLLDTLRIKMNKKDRSITALQVAQADSYIKKRHAKGRLLDAIVALDFAINTDIFTKEDIAYMASKYKNRMKEGR